MTQSPETRSIEVTNLRLSSDNPRFKNFIEYQHECLLELADSKLVSLAENIVKLGFVPFELPIVMPDAERENIYTVKEGNRRVAAIKILTNPEIISETNDKIYKRFKELHGEFLSNPIEKIQCFVTDDEELALELMQLRHTGENDGAGIIKWTTSQISQFQHLRGKKLLITSALNYFYTSNFLNEVEKEKMQHINVTNFNRLFQDPYVRNNTGILYDTKTDSFSLELDNPKKMAMLHKVIGDLISDEPLVVATIYHKKDREDYILKTQNEILAKGDFTPKPSPIPSPNPTPKSSPKPKTKKDNDDPKLRETLIPKSCQIHITEEGRLNPIYHELKKIKITDFPNAVSVLFRVFLELSMDKYCEKMKIIITPNTSLNDKLIKVVDDMESKKILGKDPLKYAKNLSNHQNNSTSVNSLNAYVHNRYMFPSPGELKIGWDGIQIFISKVHEVIDKE